jgi:hypothetical protein
MPYPAEQNFPPGYIKAVIVLDTESHADHSDKRKYRQSEQVLAFPGYENSAI